MRHSLATKYRPQDFEDVSSQISTIAILKRQLELKQFFNVYGFFGPTGVGKTTLARILANKINNGHGSPIEIDGASNNGVDNVRMIIQEAWDRSIDSEYKIYIIDECHSITTAAWNAFLKCLEEPPAYTIFMFCTTDPQKLPPTILNRMMKFTLGKIPVNDIRQRLSYICQQEGFTDYEESCSYIAGISDGGMRTAIATLEKCANYSSSLSLATVVSILGNASFDTMFSLTNAIIDGDEKTVLELVNTMYINGVDLKLFIDTYLDFTLDLIKVCIFNDLTLVSIPGTMEQQIKYTINITDNTTYFNKVMVNILDIKNMIRNETSIKNVVLASLLKMCRG